MDHIFVICIRVLLFLSNSIDFSKITAHSYNIEKSIHFWWWQIYLVITLNKKKNFILKYVDTVHWKSWFTVEYISIFTSFFLLFDTSKTPKINIYLLFQNFIYRSDISWQIYDLHSNYLSKHFFHCLQFLCNFSANVFVSTPFWGDYNS